MLKKLLTQVIFAQKSTQKSAQKSTQLKFIYILQTFIRFGVNMNESVLELYAQVQRTNRLTNTHPIVQIHNNSY